MCDLFALSADTGFAAPKSLPIFADRAWKNMDGWGIGFFRKGSAFVEKSASRVYQSGRIHDSFQRIARVVKSRIILAHVRMRTSGPVDECHAHPFVLHFGGCDWLFAHNGKAPAIESYTTRYNRIDCVVSDSGRAFEFLRDRLMGYYNKRGFSYPFVAALKQSTQEMIREYPGKYNYLLTNGIVLYVFTNHRHFMVLKGSSQLDNALLLTTVDRGLSEEKWVRFACDGCRYGLLVAIAGTEILLEESF